MSVTRRATSNDVEAILPLLKAFHVESILKDVELDEAKLRAFLADCIQHPSRVCFVYESTAIDGLIIGYSAEYFFSTKKGAWDLVFYVRPERRGRMIAYRLVSAFKAWAATSGAGQLWLGTAAGIDVSLTRKFYLGLGMEQVGDIFRLDFTQG
jgi:GNAT superfamily N-acetyltransferase